MASSLTSIELQALNLLLEGSDERLQVLRAQLPAIESTASTRSGVGIFTKFRLAKDAIPLPNRGSFALSDVDAEVNSGEVYCGFILFVKEGFLDELESVCHYGDWPENIRQFRLFRTEHVVNANQALNPNGTRPAC